MKKAKNLADLGKLAGVSTATVSRALRDSPEIGEAMKQKIRLLAKEHNYAINAGARNLRLQKTDTVAVILNAYDKLSGKLSAQPYLLTVLAELSDELAKCGLSMLLSSERSVSQCWNDYFVRSGRADGIIVLGQSDDVTTLNKLSELGTPFVVYGAYRKQEPYCVVGCDNRKGGALATEHLLNDAGRKKIVYLGPTENFDGLQRIEGYRQALAYANIEVSRERILSCALGAEFADKRLGQALREGLEFDAVFACSDEIAMGAVRCLQRYGLSVPKDVSVVGFDDLPAAAHYSPALTTIRPHDGDLAQTLVNSLQEMIIGNRVVSTEITSQLVVRDSSI